MIANKAFATFLGAFARLPVEQRDLAGDFVICPPDPNSGYQSTPANALTFSRMGVDGVHDAILKIGGVVREESPVVQVSPMDSHDVFIIAPTFVDYLADGCAVTPTTILAILAAEEAGQPTLAAFLNEHFSGVRLLGEERLQKLEKEYANHIERRPQAP